MTDKTLTGLTAATVFAATDLLYAKVGANSRKIAGSGTFNMGALALGGATIGANALAVTGTALLNSATTLAANSAVSIPALIATGTWITGGSTTTNKPHVLIEPAGTTSTTWDVNGTGLGVNANGGNDGVIADFQFNGVSQLKIYRTATAGNCFANAAFVSSATFGNTIGTASIFMGSTSALHWTTGANPGLPNSATDLFLTRGGPASLQLGNLDTAVAVAQTLRVQSVVAGTAAANGANLTIIGSLPTGTGTSGDIIFQTGVKTGSGTTQGTPTTALTIKGETRQVNIATVMTINGASIGTDALAVTGTATFSGNVVVSNIFASQAILSGALVTPTGASGGMAFGVQGGITSAADGVFLFRDTAGTSLGRLQFGGTTSAFPAIARDGAGIKIVGGDGTSVSWINIPPVAVGSLPAAATAGEGARSFVTDALTPVFGSIVAAGGAANVPVYSDGTNWIVG